MTAARKLGIWMDPSTAHVMEFAAYPIVTKTILLSVDPAEKNYGFGKNEIMMHNKEKHRQKEYYNKLGDVIKQYSDVILFGPTEAKVELFNRLTKEPAFDNTRIKIEHADKMTENQQHAFVRDYFTTSKEMNINDKSKFTKIN